ncbi:MAG: cytidine deaminase [Oscillospiraceae bacterium]|nr:cytidine deaminase [Oscillospiraceae bacterium]
MEYKKLVEQAIIASKNAYCVVSNYKVGAALLAKNGKVYLGCNIENSACSVTNCAERTAFFNAISDGEKEFEAIAIVGGLYGDFSKICPPCGVCRQVMNEFCDEDFKIILGKKDGEYEEHLLKNLFPLGFVLQG